VALFNWSIEPNRIIPVITSFRGNCSAFHAFPPSSRFLRTQSERTERSVIKNFIRNWLLYNRVDDSKVIKPLRRRVIQNVIQNEINQNVFYSIWNINPSNAQSQACIISSYESLNIDDICILRMIFIRASSSWRSLYAIKDRDICTYCQSWMCLRNFLANDRRIRWFLHSKYTKDSKKIALAAIEPQLFFW